jgi:hypothetical protein
VQNLLALLSLVAGLEERRVGKKEGKLLHSDFVDPRIRRKISGNTT